MLLGCAVKSITPSAGGLEIDVDLADIDFRHGWTYHSRPKTTEVVEMDEDSVKRGQNLYQQHCQKCHGESGKGGGELAEALKLKPADLTNLPKDLSRTYILVQINDGKGSMPEWKSLLTPKQTQDLTSYLKKLSLGKK